MYHTFYFGYCKVIPLIDSNKFKFSGFNIIVDVAATYTKYAQLRLKMKCVFWNYDFNMIKSKYNKRVSNLASEPIPVYSFSCSSLLNKGINSLCE